MSFLKFIFIVVVTTFINFEVVTSFKKTSAQKSLTAPNYYYLPVKSGNKHISSSASGKTNITLSTIEDIEMLTYFLLWKHDYFDNAPDLNSIQRDLEEDSNRLSESKLREFIEKLKIKHLITNRPLSGFNLSKDLCTSPSFEAHLTTHSRYWSSSGNSKSSSTKQKKDFTKARAICEAAADCRSPKQLTRLIGLSSTPNATLSQSISRLCPLMLFQLQEKECVDRREVFSRAKNAPSAGAVWGFAILFVTIVTFCALAGVGVLPFLTDTSYEVLITVLQGLAVGSTVGSALFHLIPQAFNLAPATSTNDGNPLGGSNNGNDQHEYLWRALIIFSGIYLFFWFERLMKIISEWRRKRKMKVEVSVPSSTSVYEMPELENKMLYGRHVGFTSSSPPNGLLSGPQQQPQQLKVQQLTVNNNPHHLNDDSDDTDDSDDDDSEIEAEDDHYNQHHHHHHRHRHQDSYRRHQPPAPPPPTPRERANSNLLLNSTLANQPQQQQAVNGNGNSAVSKGSGNKGGQAGKGSNQPSTYPYNQNQSSRSSGEVATIAWMIILGDGMHNFINGVTIGAAFTQSIMEGISISVAVVCEEFPHELGDFSLLISSGMSMRKALGYNFISACTCYLGMIVGILIGDFSNATPYVFALAGGMFLYISLVDMMGELSTNLEAANRKRGLRFTAQMLILQNVGILIGVSIMFSLAKYSDKINFEGLVPPKNSDMPFTES